MTTAAAQVSLKLPNDGLSAQWAGARIIRWSTSLAHPWAATWGHKITITSVARVRLKRTLSWTFLDQTSTTEVTIPAALLNVRGAVKTPGTGTVEMPISVPDLGSWGDLSVDIESAVHLSTPISVSISGGTTSSGTGISSTQSGTGCSGGSPSTPVSADPTPVVTSSVLTVDDTTTGDVVIDGRTLPSSAPSR